MSLDHPYYPSVKLVAKNFVYDLIQRCGNNLTINGRAIEIMISEVSQILDSHHYKIHFEGYYSKKDEMIKAWKEYEEYNK